MELFLTAIALSMDCAAICLAGGAQIVKISFLFGFFQGAMPACGYALGREFVGFIQSVDHFVAFGILGFLGAKMIKQSRSRVQSSLNLGLGALFLAAFATSVDALAVGVTMGFSEINIVSSAVIIGIVCFAISVIASLVGNKLGQMLGSKALVLGGIILILIGLKILISHLLE